MIYVGIASCGVIASWSYTAKGEGSEVVGSSHMKLFTEGGYGAVAIGIDGSCDEARGQRVSWSESVVMANFCIPFDELGIRCFE